MPGRYAFLLAQMLNDLQAWVCADWYKKKAVLSRGKSSSLREAGITGIDTITLYIGPQNQPEWYEYLLAWN